MLNWDELEPNVQESYLGAEPSIARRLSSSSSAFVSSSLSSSSSSSRADTNLLFLGLCTKAEKSRAPDGRPNGEEGLRVLAPATDLGLSPPEPPAAEPCCTSDRPDHRRTQFRFSIDANQASSRAIDLSLSAACHLITSDQHHLTHFFTLSVTQGLGCESNLFYNSFEKESLSFLDFLLQENLCLPSLYHVIVFYFCLRKKFNRS